MERYLMNLRTCRSLDELRATVRTCGDMFRTGQLDSEELSLFITNLPSFLELAEFDAIEDEALARIEAALSDWHARRERGEEVPPPEVDAHRRTMAMVKQGRAAFLEKLLALQWPERIVHVAP